MKVARSDWSQSFTDTTNKIGLNNICIQLNNELVIAFVHKTKLFKKKQLGQNTCEEQTESTLGLRIVSQTINIHRRKDQVNNYASNLIY